MLLVIDVGNTNMVFGLFRGERLEGSFRLKTDANSTSDELGLYLCEYFQRFGLRLDEVVTSSSARWCLRSCIPSAAPSSNMWGRLR